VIDILAESGQPDCAARKEICISIAQIFFILHSHPALPFFLITLFYLPNFPFGLKIISLFSFRNTPIYKNAAYGSMAFRE